MIHTFSVRAWLAILTFLFAFCAAISVPSCQSVPPAQNILSSVRTAQVSVPNDPFGVVYARQKHKAFVSLPQTLGVLDTSTFPPSLVHEIPLPDAYVKYEGATGISLSHDGHHVFVAAGQGAIIIDTKRALAGRSDAVVGTLNGTTTSQQPGFCAIEVTLAKHDRYAFVSQEYGYNGVAGCTYGAATGNIDVFELGKTDSNGSISGTAVGFLNLGHAVVGTALSPSGHRLYAVSETTTTDAASSGSLSVIDVKKLKRKPSQALLSTVTAGCSPVRVIVSADGEVVWVTARGSNHLLAFKASKLVSDPDNALLASVQVGSLPVGLALVRNGKRILTADSNRLNNRNTTSGISVIDVEAALNGSNNAVLGTIPTGLFPREFAVSPDGSTVLVTDHDSRQIQAIDVSTLP